MPKTKARGLSGRRPDALELMGESLPSVAKPTPRFQGSRKKKFDCPLCFDVFGKFSQLKSHLLSMHPRREMIMRIVTERYGSSKRRTETSTSSASGSQHAQELSTSFEQRAGNLEETVERTVATTNTFEDLLKSHAQAVVVAEDNQFN